MFFTRRALRFLLMVSAVFSLLMTAAVVSGDEEGGEDGSGYGRDRDYNRDSDDNGRSGGDRDSDGRDGDGTGSGNTGSGRGTVVFYANNSLFRVTPSGGRKVSPPGGGYVSRLRDAGKGRMILTTSTKKTYLWDVRQNRFTAIPASAFSYYGTVAWIKDRYALAFVPKYTTTWLYATQKGGRAVLQTTYRRYVSGKFDFLPDGRHLFVHTPGMGRKESLYFIDKIIGGTQYLYYIPSFPGSPRRLLTGDVFGNPVLTDSGKRILYWRLQRVDTARNRRYLELRSVSVTGGKSRRVVTVTTKARTRAYQRWMPSTIVYRKSGLLLVESGDQGGGQWRRAAAAGSGSRPFSTRGGFLIKPVGSKIFGRNAIRDQETPAAVILKRSAGRNLLQVYGLNGGKLLFSGELPMKLRRLYRSLANYYQATYVP